jgi:tRNA(Ile)-lysidine synthetase-like protein
MPGSVFLRKSSAAAGFALEAEIAAFFSKEFSESLPMTLVAYSGGVDSGTLLLALAKLTMMPLCAIHVVHNLRSGEELRKERALVAEVCADLRVPLAIEEIERGKIERVAAQRGIGVEAAARMLRYSALKRVAEKQKARVICTAHNADDQAETMLLRLISGSSLDGLKGIQPTRQIGHGLLLARPMLSVPRSEIERYAEREGLKYSIDSSNSDPHFLRNRVRSKIIPTLDSYFPGWRSGIRATIEKLSSDSQVIDDLFSQASASANYDMNTNIFTINRADYFAAPDCIKQRILSRAIGKVSRSDRISSRSVTKIMRDLAKGVRKLTVRRVSVEISNTALLISPILDFKGEDGYFFQIFAEGKYSAGIVVLTALWSAPDGDMDKIEKEARTSACSLYEGSFEFPLIVRSRKPGDSILAAGRMVRVDDVLKGMKIRPEARDRIPIAEDRRGIVAVLAGAYLGSNVVGAKYRDYSGSKLGRKFFLNIKGA